MDGPRDLHDHYRTYPNGDGTFKKVMKAAHLLQKNKVPFNILAILNSRIVKHPKRILNFFLDQGFFHLQFIPAIETIPPYDHDLEQKKRRTIAPFTPHPLEVGKFWDKIFTEWAKNFPPRFSVRYFEALIAAQLGQPVGYCKIDETCGSYLVVEHNGDVYPCDFFVEEDKKLGNLNQKPLQDIAQTKQFISFAQAKSELPKDCQNCKFLKFCWGGCQRYRNLPGGPENGTYLCEAYRYFLSRNLKKIKEIATEVANRSH